MSTALIGDSILEFINQTSDINNAPRSVIHSLVENETRILLQGPHATSLAMNTACAIASHCKCRLVSCQCAAAVTFLTCRRDDSSFPLFCQEAPQTLDDLETKLRNLENATATWNQRALKRIQVVRFQSARSLLAYLLDLHAKQQQQQRPWGALIVDGVDQFVMDGDEKSTTGSISPEGVMRMIQIFAVLADTGKTLQQMGTDPILVMATTRFPLPLNVERIVRNWYPCVATVEQRCGKPHWRPPSGDAIQSSWLAKLDDSDKRAAVEFSVVMKSNAERVILWGQNT